MVDTEIVQRFVAQAANATPEQRAVVISRLQAMIERKERSRNPQTGEWVSLETMAATVTALMETSLTPHTPFTVTYTRCGHVIEYGERDYGKQIDQSHDSLCQECYRRTPQFEVDQRSLNAMLARY